MPDMEVKSTPRRGGIAERVRELLFDAVIEEGCYLWDVEYVREGTEWILRIVIDTNDGVTLDDCERVTRRIDPMLDEADPIESSYRLEVTSPGIERPLTRPDHFEACVGEEIEVRLYAPLDGQKTLRGILSATEDKKFSLTTPDGRELSFDKSAAAKVSTVFSWDASGEQKQK